MSKRAQLKAVSRTTALKLTTRGLVTYRRFTESACGFSLRIASHRRWGKPLAALLHHVGKEEQRSEAEPEKSSDPVVRPDRVYTRNAKEEKEDR